MITFQETRIEIADRHTTFYYFQGKNPGSRPIGLPFGDADAYRELHDKIFIRNVLPYEDVVANHSSALKSFSLGYCENTYWHWYLQTPTAPDYPAEAWRRALPLHASLKSSIVLADGSGLSFSVKPKPRVVLYPFGWSTWLSLLVRGPHTLTELKSFLERAFIDDLFEYEGHSGKHSIPSLLKVVAAQVRVDAFGGGVSRVVNVPEFMTCTTVMAKDGGSLSSAAITQIASCHC